MVLGVKLFTNPGLTKISLSPHSMFFLTLQLILTIYFYFLTFGTAVSSANRPQEVFCVSSEILLDCFVKSSSRRFQKFFLHVFEQCLNMIHFLQCRYDSYQPLKCWQWTEWWYLRQFQCPWVLCATRERNSRPDFPPAGQSPCILCASRGNIPIRSPIRASCRRCLRTFGWWRAIGSATAAQESRWMPFRPCPIGLLRRCRVPIHTDIIFNN